MKASWKVFLFSLSLRNRCFPCGQTADSLNTVRSSISTTQATHIAIAMGQVGWKGHIIYLHDAITCHMPDSTGLISFWVCARMRPPGKTKAREAWYPKLILWFGGPWVRSTCSSHGSCDKKAHSSPSIRSSRPKPSKGPPEVVDHRGQTARRSVEGHMPAPAT